MTQENIDVLTISTLLEDVAAAKACCAQKEEELQHLREQTAELVAAQLAEAGSDEDYVQAAKAMWVKDPQSTSQAIAGGSIKEMLAGDFVQSARGCNQYKHKPGCDEADGEVWQSDREINKMKKTGDDIKETLEIVADNIRDEAMDKLSKKLLAQSNELLTKIEEIEKEYKNERQGHKKGQWEAAQLRMRRFENLRDYMKMQSNK